MVTADVRQEQSENGCGKSMKKQARINLIRTVRRTLPRFLAIFAITALGVGFLTGLLCTAPDMKESVDRYYDVRNFMDLDIKGTAGLTEEDIRLLRSDAAAAAVTPVIQKDDGGGGKRR